MEYRNLLKNDLESMLLRVWMIGREECMRRILKNILDDIMTSRKTKHAYPEEFLKETLRTAFNILRRSSIAFSRNRTLRFALTSRNVATIKRHHGRPPLP